MNNIILRYKDLNHLIIQYSLECYYPEDAVLPLPAAPAENSWSQVIPRLVSRITSEDSESSQTRLLVLVDRFPKARLYSTFIVNLRWLNLRVEESQAIVISLE